MNTTNYNLRKNSATLKRLESIWSVNRSILMVVFFGLFSNLNLRAQYMPNLDVSGLDEINGAKVQLATPSLSHFLRLFSGDEGDPKPYLLFSNADDFRISSSKENLTGFQDLLTVKGDGRVGIGTDSPVGMLHVQGLTWTNIAAEAIADDPSFQLTSDGSSINNDWTIRMDVYNNDPMQWRYDGIRKLNLTTTGDLEVEKNMIVKGDVQLGSAGVLNPVPGSMRWDGQDFLGWNGFAWVSLTSFKLGPEITDIDGNKYQTVWIGNQLWMAQNLRTTTYRNGTPIPHVTDNTEWSGLTSGAWCWYDNSTSYEQPYGKLYNWYAVNDISGLCPSEWRVPTESDWTTLADFLGGVGLAGGKMKEAGTSHWDSPNTGATNETGFSGLPGGGRDEAGLFHNTGSAGYWWSSIEQSGTFAWLRNLSSNDDNLDNTLFFLKKSGLSVRCLKGGL